MKISDGMTYSKKLTMVVKVEIWFDFFKMNIFSMKTFDCKHYSNICSMQK